jgi:hypothetical protein
MTRGEFASDDDFDTEWHRLRREEGWLGGPFTELRYFLSCLTRINYERTPFEVWEPAARDFISNDASSTGWITRSTYFPEFAVLLLRELYRQSDIGKRYPIRAETRQEKATRFALAHPNLNIEELAKRLKTTVKQLQRNSSLMLALREYQRATTVTSTADR